MTESDARLVEMAVAGNDAAFDELVARHRGRVCRVARRIVGCREAADDIAQDALVRAYLTLHTLREPARFGAWVIGIAENLCRMHVRAQREFAVPYSVMDGLVPAQPALGLGELPARLDLLAAGTRDAAQLYFVQGKKMREVGQELGISLSAVKSRIRDARRGLQLEETTMKSRQKPKGDAFDRELKRRLELARWYREFGTLASSGVQILHILDRLSDGPYSKPVVDAAKKLRVAVQNGNSMSDAMRDLPALRTPETAPMVRAGDVGGILDRTTLVLADWIDAGSAQREIELSFWLRTLGAMIDAGVPLDSALSWGVEFPANPGLRDILKRVAQAVSEGEPITPIVMEAGDVLPPMARVSIAAGERAGCLGFAFQFAGRELASSVCKRLMSSDPGEVGAERRAEFAVELGRQVSSGGDDLRRAAAMALGSLGQRASANAVAEFLQDPDADVRIAAAESLAKLCARTHADRVAPLLDDPEARVRTAAILALGDLEAHEHAAKLCSMIDDPDAPTADTAVETCERLGEVDELVKAAIRYLMGERSPAWFVAAHILHAHPVPDAIPALLRALDEEPATPWTSVLAALALARLGRREGVPLLRKTLGMRWGSSVWQAAEALESLGDRDSADAIRDAVRGGRLTEEWLDRADRLASDPRS